ncbi:MAG: hypothetical protein ACYCWE_16225 [Eubacteriales bacterium]
MEKKFKDADKRNTAQDNRIHPINRINDKDSRYNISGKNIQENKDNKQNNPDNRNNYEDIQNNQDNRNNHNIRQNNKY